MGSINTQADTDYKASMLPRLSHASLSDSADGSVTRVVHWNPLSLHLTHSPPHSLLALHTVLVSRSIRRSQGQDLGKASEDSHGADSTHEGGLA